MATYRKAIRLLAKPNGSQLHWQRQGSLAALKTIGMDLVVETIMLMKQFEDDPRRLSSRTNVAAIPTTAAPMIGAICLR
jgi:hypothetical protein